MALRRKTLTTVAEVRLYALKAQSDAVDRQIEHDNKANNAAYADAQQHHEAQSEYWGGVSAALTELVKRLPKGD